MHRPFLSAPGACLLTLPVHAQYPAELANDGGALVETIRGSGPNGAWPDTQTFKRLEAWRKRG